MIAKNARRRQWSDRSPSSARITVLLFFFCFGSGKLFAQPIENGADDAAKAHARASEFLESLSDKDTTVERAYDELLRGGPLAGKRQAIEPLAAKTKDLESRFGAFRAAERIESRRIGSDVLLLKYLYKCDNFPVVWYFTFYRDQRPGIPADSRTWSVIAVRFDTEIELLGL